MVPCVGFVANKMAHIKSRPARNGKGISGRGTGAGLGGVLPIALAPDPTTEPEPRPLDLPFILGSCMAALGK